MGKATRNYGIDLLRMVSILGVAFLHILGHGGVLASTTSHIGFSAVWFLELLALPAVNCFVLISGYIGYREEKYFPKLKNLVSLFFTVLFYSALICIGLKLLKPDAIGIRQMINAFLPVTQKQYWFFTAYFGMFLLSPMLNFFVHKAGKKQIFIFLIILAFFSFATLFYDAFSLINGYSLIWFLFIYTLGAIIKKYNLNGLFTFKKILLLGLAALFITWLPKITFSLSRVGIVSKHADMFIDYTSPTVVVMALAWLCLFSKIKCKGFMLPIISFCSSSVFSVYLIHDNLYVRRFLISGEFKLLNTYNPALTGLAVIGIALGIFIVCIIIDKIRIWLFNLLRVDKLAQIVADFITRMVNLVYDKFCKATENNV